MRRVASCAAFDLHRFVLVNKRTRFVLVACKANLILRRCSAQLTRLETAMRIVTIRALHQAFVYAVMERPFELLFFIEMAGVAKIRLLHLQKVLAFLGMVRIMAVRAAHTILQVNGAGIIAVLFAILVAVEAPRANLLRCGVLKREDLGLVTPAFHMLLAGTMASLATVPFGPVLRVERRGEVW